MEEVSYLHIPLESHNSQSSASLSSPSLSSPLLFRRTSQWSKRGFDILCAIVGLILLAPVLIVVACCIGLTSSGPIFYRATRVGYGGKLFRLYKFRTMRLDADRSGPGITRANDERITRVGHYLRQSKIDEIPQLLNVLSGEMSLVGPRPEDPRYVAHYTPYERDILTVRPGITSLASIRYRNEEALLSGDEWETLYINHLMRDKLRVDRLYIEKWSLGLDLQILFYTFFVLSSTEATDLL